MDKKIIVKLAGATLGFLILLGIVTAIAWHFQELDARKLETIYVVIAFTPFVFYLFLSDKLKQFKGGGIEFTLRDEVDKDVSGYKDDEPIEFSQEMVDAKGGENALQNMLEREPPTTLSLEIGKPQFYASQAIKRYIDALSSSPSFKYVLFEDSNKKFLGYIHKEDFKKLLENTPNIVPRIEDGGILQDSRVRKDSIPKDTSNKQALNKMDSLNITELAVVDENQQFRGTITQDEIVRKILTKVIQEV